MVPATLQLLDSLPLSSNGKVDRGALGQMATQASRTQEVYVAPATETERRIAGIWADVLGRDRISASSDFFELGGQSFAALRVVNQIAREFEVTLSLGSVLEARTIRGLACLIERGAKQSPLVRLNEVAGTDGRVALLVHPAGGNVVCYRGLAAALPIATYGLQAVGLQQAATPETSVKELAACYLEAVLAAGLTGPFVVGGWSSGGIIAHELTLQLEARGKTVERLVVLDVPAPCRLPEVSAREMLAWFIEDLNIGVTAADVLSTLSAAWNPDETADVWRWVSERHPSAPPSEQLQSVLRLFSRVVRACRSHETTRVKAPVYLLRAQLGRVTEFLRHPDDARWDWGWREFTSADIKIGASPSSHHTLLQEQHLEHVLELFRT
jgi:thioesterase domain-containing protein/acyl carrier protein